MTNSEAEKTDEAFNFISQSPSIPKPSIVQDEFDVDLNKDRQTLAIIRKERAASWQLD